jgi:Family of unknown function (DUF5309)
MAAPVMAAAAAHTYITTGNSPTPTNIREDLADIIYEIDPTETPVVTRIGRGDNAEQVTTEWLVQELNAAGKNAQPEGFEATYGDAKAPDRLANVCQIMSRTVSVSNTMRASNTVGSDDEYDRQRILRGLEIKRDLEFALTNPQAKKATDPREMGSLQAFIANVSVGASGAAAKGDGTDVPTPGTDRPLSLDLIASVMEQCFNNGGSPNIGVLSAALKRGFSNLAAGGATGAAQNVLQTTRPEPVTVVGAVDVYRTDFGPIEMVPDRFMAAKTVLLLDPDYAELAVLPGRDMITEDYAKTGDARKGGVVFEGTLRVNAPKAHGAVYGVTPPAPAPAVPPAPPAAVV